MKRNSIRPVQPEGAEHVKVMTRKRMMFYSPTLIADGGGEMLGTGDGKVDGRQHHTGSPTLDLFLVLFLDHNNRQ